jgi:hypothetical protein
MSFFPDYRTSFFGHILFYPLVSVFGHLLFYPLTSVFGHSLFYPVGTLRCEGCGDLNPRYVPDNYEDVTNEDAILRCGRDHNPPDPNRDRFTSIPDNATVLTSWIHLIR